MKLLLRYHTGYYIARLSGKKATESIKAARERAKAEVRRMVSRSVDALVRNIGP